MPSYQASPFTSSKMLTPGLLSYAFGAWSEDIAPTRMTVSNVALTSNVATLTVQVVEGNVPVVGMPITVLGTTSTSGLFNVTAVALSAVSVNANGAGTVSFPLTHADVVSVANTGNAIAEQAETTDALANGASLQFAVQAQPSFPNDGRSLKAVVSMPSLPTTATVTLQEAAFDQAAEYSDLATVASVTGGVLTGGQLTVTGTPGRFYRLNVSSVTGGTNPTIIGKLLT